MNKFKKFLKTPTGNIIGLSVFLFVSILLYYFYAVSQNKTATVATNDQKIAVLETDHTRGSKTASVVIVEYGDFQCPACRAYESVTNDILKKYPETVSLTFRHFPLIQIHKNAFLAASYVEAASLQGKFWEMHDKLYEKQEEWGETLDAETRIQGYAKELGLDIKALTVAANSTDVQQRVVASYKEASLLKLGGTPSFFINGKKIDSQNLSKEVEAAVQSLKK